MTDNTSSMNPLAYTLDMVEGVYFAITVIEEGSDNIIEHTSLVLDEAGGGIILASTTPISETVVDRIFFSLDEKEYPWRELWDISEDTQTPIELYFINKRNMSEDEEHMFPKVVVYCKGPEEVQEKIWSLVENF